MRTLTAALAMVTLAASLGLVQPARTAGSDPGVGGDLARIPVVGFTTRLQNLRPDKAENYLFLAEELASESHVRESRDLSRALYVLAFEIDRKQPSSNGRIARSACSGLAALTRNEAEQRRLLAIGQIVAGQASRVRGERPVLVKPMIPPSDETALNLVTAIGLARAGEGRRAEQYLGREGVRSLLESTEGLFGGFDRQGASANIERWINDWPACPTCKNKRIVSRSGAEPQLCKHCEGNPGPRLSDAELLMQVRGESLLLRGVHRSWSAQLVADGGEPLRDPLPEDLALQYGVDANATIWRDGRWIAP